MKKNHKASLCRLSAAVLTILLGLIITQECRSEETPAVPTKQLIVNGDFENVTENGKLSNWILFGIHDKNNAIEPDVTEKYSGKYSLKMVKNGETRLTIQTMRGIPMDSGNNLYSKRLKISAEIKLKDIVADGANSDYPAVFIGLYSYDENKKLIGKDALFSRMGSGSADWEKYEKIIHISPETAYINIVATLNKCRGTMLLDDLCLSEEPIPEYLSKDILDSNVPAPFILPTPWKSDCQNEWIEMDNTCIIAPEEKEQERTTKKLSEFIFELTGKNISVYADKKPDMKFDSVYIIGSRQNSTVADYIKSIKVEVPWEELGAEGYFLWSGKIEDKKVVILAANEAAGIFYAFQSLKQLIKPGAPLSIRKASIIDRPLFKKRGIFAGSYLGKRTKDDFIKIMPEFKMNYLFLQGGLLRQRFSEEFRIPFSQEEIKTLKELNAYAKDNFIQVQLGFAIVKTNKPIVFSSKDDVQSLLNKIDVLCEIGFKQFALSFDDISSKGFDNLYNEEDKKMFHSAGESHAYLITKVHDYLKAKGNEYRLDVVPMTYYFDSGYYDNPKYKSYLEDISTVPQDIQFIACGGHSYRNVANIKAITDIFYPIGKHHPIVLGTWADFDRKPIPFIAPPFKGPKDLYKHADAIFGGLMQPPSKEGPVLISWYSSADYMWNPEAYNPDESVYKRLLLFAGTPETAKSLMKYVKWESGLQDILLPDKGSASDRIEYCTRLLHDIEKYSEAFRSLIEKYPLLGKSLEKSKENITMLLEHEQKRTEFPFSIPDISVAGNDKEELKNISWDKAKPISEFYVIGRNKEPANPKTTVLIGHDKKNLYLKFKCMEVEPGKILAKYKNTHKDAPVYLDDSIDIFIDSEQNSKIYYHLIINSIGAIYDEKISDESWNGEYEISTEKDNGSWSIKVRIPCKNFGISEIRPGMRWNINFMRERKVPPTQNSVWSFSEKSFITPTRFETIEFR